jgi:tetratricopeptide (TPR) repeat protein
MVLNSSRQPVSDLYVELLDDVERSLQRAKTDGTGRFAFSGIPQGTFYVRVQTFGTNLVSQTVRVTVFNASVGATTGRYHEEVSFTLKSADEEKARLGPKSSPATVFSQEVPDPARERYEEAIQVLDDGKGRDQDQGIEALKRAIEIFPAYYQALERLGAEYVKQQQYDEALKPLRKAIEVNPKGNVSLHTLGVAQYYLKRLSESLDSLRRAVSLAPNSANSQFWLGIVLFRSGKMAEAESPLKRAYQLAGKQIPDVHMYLAQIYSNTNRYKEAADELDLFLKDAPDARDPQNIKALIAQLRAKAKG